MTTQKKAYSAKLLVEKMKNRGLDVAEDAAIALTEGFFDYLEESAQLSDTKIDDGLSLAYPAARKKILELADKIDGKQG